MALDGVLYTFADYVPCLDCADVRLVDAVLVAELTDDVREALADGAFPEPTCVRCGTPLPAGAPILLCSPGPETSLTYSPSAGADDPHLGAAASLLLALRARRASWPDEDPTGLRVVPRPDLSPFAAGDEDRGTIYSIPRELWEKPDPPPLPAPGPERLHHVWDQLVEAERETLARFVEHFGGADASEARHDAIVGMARRLTHAHIRRYKALDDPDSLSLARQAITQALAFTSSPARKSEILADRGTVAFLEYDRSRDAELIREALAANQEALECNPGNSVAAGGLGAALLELRTWTDDPATLDAGVDTLRRAVADTGKSGGDRAVRLNNLGNALSARWDDTHDRRDLSEAAVALAEAIALTPSGSPDAAARLDNLGTVRLRTHGQDGGDAMLAAAIEALDAAVAASAPADPAAPRRRAHLATALWRRDGPGDAARAVDLSRAALAGGDDDPAGALTAARNWCVAAFQHERWEQVTEAYAEVLAASDHLLERQLTGEARRAQLRPVQGLPDLAAFAWARLGDGLAAAQAIEAGRARLLADALELVASGVEAARSGAPELVARRERLVREIAAAERALEDEGTDGERRIAMAGDVRRLRQELTDAMAEINAVAPAGATPELVNALAGIEGYGPLVHVACTPAGTVASVSTGEPLAADLVWAPSLTSSRIDELLAGQRTEDGLDAALATVGAELVGQLAPLLARHAGQVITFSLPAALARLPLAAAPFTVDGQDHRLVDDHVTALLPAVSVAPSAVERMGVRRLGGVANPAREGLPSLPFAASELRAAALRLPAADEDLLVGPAAKVDDLLAVLGHCSHLHLACHGEFRPEEPLESCLRLADGDLSLRRMQRVEHAADLSLLMLSACESAQSDTVSLPDEMIGLPAAFLQLGARAVIGALWPVPDLPTTLLMGRFYRELAEDDLDVGQALRLAQNWVRSATAGDVGDFLAGAVDDGPDAALLLAAARMIDRQYAPDERPFANTSQWAAFVLFGGAHARGSA